MYVCTLKVDGDVDDTRVLVVSNKYLPISFIVYTRRLNRRRNRTVAPVDTSTTRNMLSHWMLATAPRLLDCASALQLLLLQTRQQIRQQPTTRSPHSRSHKNIYPTLDFLLLVTYLQFSIQVCFPAMDSCLITQWAVWFSHFHFHFQPEKDIFSSY